MVLTLQVVLKADGKVHSVTVRDVQLSEAGQVTLSGKDFQTEASLFVKGKTTPDLILLTSLKTRSKLRPNEELAPPSDFKRLCSEPPVEFTKPLEDQTVEEESTATLECEISRDNAEVQWFRDGQDIRKTKKYEVVADGRKRILLIHECTTDDSRTYTCDAKDFKTSCFLNVERKSS